MEVTGNKATDRELALIADDVRTYHDTENLYARKVEDVPTFDHKGPNIECQIHLQGRHGYLEWWICSLRYGDDHYVRGNGDDPESALRHAVLELRRSINDRRRRTYANR